MDLRDDPVRVGILEKLATLFPKGCGLFVQSAAAVSLSELHVEEASAIDRAVPKRQHEFAAGRVAARRALAQIGKETSAIPMNADRSPRWPPDAVGSISHCGDLAVAVVAPKSEWLGIGLDIEQSAAVGTDLWESLFVTEEIDWLRHFNQEEEQRRWATLFFSAKESFFKLQYPMTGEWLDFHGASITPDLESRSFDVALRNEKVAERIGRSAFRGKFRFTDGYTLTALCLRN